MIRRTLPLVVVLALLSAACAGSSAEGSTTTAPGETTTGPVMVSTTTTAPVETTTTVAPTSTSTPAVPTTTSAGSSDGAEGSGCNPGTDATLPDGRWFGFVTVSTADTVEFDLACWFIGQAAVDAAAEDGEESPPPNDYYVRNTNELMRTLVVSPAAYVTFYPTGDPNTETQGTLAEWRAVVEERGPYFGVWLDVTGGEVTTITEQWVP